MPSSGLVFRRRLVAVAPLFMCGLANAAGFQISEQNVSGLGSVYAGQSALGEDASAIYFNPAQLTRLAVRRGRRGQIVLGGSYIKPSSRFSDDGSCAPYAGTGAGSTACPFGPGGNLGHANGGEGPAVDDGAVVPFLYAAWSPDTNWWIGIGIGGPFGLGNNRSPDWVGRFHAIDSKTRTINVNPTLAWKPEAWPVAFGIGLDAQRLRTRLTSAVSYAAAALQTQSPALIAATPPGSEGAVRIEGSDWGWGWNAGVDLDIGKAFRLSTPLNVGLAYRSKVRFSLDGTVRFEGRPAVFDAVPPLAAALGNSAASADVTLPGSASVAVAWSPSDQWTLLADYTRTGWGTLGDLSVVRASGPLAAQTFSTVAFRLRDTTRVGAGAHWHVHRDLLLRAGYAQERSSAVDEFRTPRLPDERRRFYGVGARWTLPADWVRDVSFDIAAAYSRFDTAWVALPNQATTTSAPNGSLVGRIDTHAVIGGVQLNWTF